MSYLLLVPALLALGVLLGVCVGCLLTYRREQRQLDIMTQRLLTEQRIEAMSRATLAAMQNAVRSGHR